MSREGIERARSRRATVVALLAPLLIAGTGVAARAAVTRVLPAIESSPVAARPASSSSWQLAQSGRSGTPGAAPPKRGSSAMLEGGSSADRYGGSSADSEGVAGPQHRPGTSRPRPFGKSGGGGGIDKDKQYEKDRRLEDQEDRQERQRKAEEQNRRRERGR